MKCAKIIGRRRTLPKIFEVIMWVKRFLYIGRKSLGENTFGDALLVTGTSGDKHIWWPIILGTKLTKVQGMGQKLSNTDVGGSENCGREAPTETKFSNFWQFHHEKQKSFVGRFQISWARYAYWQVFQTIPCPLVFNFSCKTAGFGQVGALFE